MAGWSTALRIARREAWRAKGRSALVLALIGLPVFALSFAAVTYDSFRLTAEQELDREIGAADARLLWDIDGPVSQSPEGYGVPVGTAGDARPPEVTPARLLAQLPPGSRVVPFRLSKEEFRTATGIGTLDVEDADLADPIHDGRIRIRDGRAPSAAGEVALSPEASRRLGAGTGDRVSLADGSASWTVVGTVEYLAEFGSRVVRYPAAPGAVPAASWLVDTVGPVTWDQVRALNRVGITVLSRAVVLDPPPPDQVAPEWRLLDAPVNREALAVGALVAVLALLEVVLLAGPAFAVGARRRQRELALVAASGGTPAQQRRIVLADGLVLGTAGAVIGIAAGAGVAVAAIPLAERQLYHAAVGAVRLWPAALAAVAGLAIVVGVLAALVPAAAAARQDVVAALAGRRGVLRSRRRWLVLGLALTALGAVVAGIGAWRVDSGMVMTGLVAGELGLVLCTPALVGLVARTGRVLPLGPRIALRDTARNRAAAAPAISAVMAAVAGSVALGMFATGEDARGDALYTPGVPVGYAYVPYQVWAGDRQETLPADQRAAVRTAMERLLPADRVIEVPGPACAAAADPCLLTVPLPARNQCPYWEMMATGPLTGAEQRAARDDPRCRDTIGATSSVLDMVVDDGTLLAPLTRASADDAAAAAATLRAGGVVVRNPMLLVDGMVTVEVRDSAEATGPLWRRTVPGYVMTSGQASSSAAFFSPALVAAEGLAVAPTAAMVVTSRVPSQAESDAFAAALTAIHPDLWAWVERQEFDEGDPTIIVLTVVAAVITLGAAGIATGLAAADRRADLSILGAVGASPRVRRVLSLSQSGVVAGLGAVLGSLAGLGAALTVLVAMNRRMAGVWPVEPLYPLRVPWPTLVVVLLVVPLVAMLGAGLFARSRLPIERRIT